MPDSTDTLQPWRLIGRIHTPFGAADQIPIQGTANTAAGTVAVLPRFAEGLADLEGFDRIWLIYLALATEPSEGLITPKLDHRPHGVFATRSLAHPNPIGLTCVRLQRIQGNTVHVTGVDMLDGTPLIDIKPYVPRYDAYPDAWAGWLEHAIPPENAWRGD